ncbi:unnamed protein product [Effrenium voratum]|uniref:Isopenicillin N synthase-like Fe(2+) 2OG dioxygenase domain-containing protein n=1 Tax=Effrenium voratum TaxID=2562239 RepID=A0AA36JS20_9DINO|nr:unnamed protein product [Effrenium voratum]CAJ1432080.1 unnamed protein product [Effrenium voratum]
MTTSSGSTGRLRLKLCPSLSATPRIVLRRPDGTVAEFLDMVQTQLRSDVSLACFVDGFALPRSELICHVLRDDEVLLVKEAEETGPRLKRQRVAPFGLTGCPSSVPCIDWADGGLLTALSACGAVFVRDDSLPDPDFVSWQGLWQQALEDHRSFRRRPAVLNRQLRFSKGEDLLRTRVGEAKAHTPDIRYNFGVGVDVMSRDWDELSWIRDGFDSVLQMLMAMMKSELASATDAEEPENTLGSKVLLDCESWAGSRLRHSVYPPNGSCTEHTDYGVVTLQQSTAPGLEAYVAGSWQSLVPPPGHAVLFAGDMLEILTNGKVPALVHRVTPGGSRQSHIIFLQPDRNTIVQPLRPFLRHDGTDHMPVKYGEWHKRKTSLAFQKP